jgi:hypothetical protein
VIFSISSASLLASRAAPCPEVLDDCHKIMTCAAIFAMAGSLCSEALSGIVAYVSYSGRSALMSTLGLEAGALLF